MVGKAKWFIWMLRTKGFVLKDPLINIPLRKHAKHPLQKREVNHLLKWKLNADGKKDLLINIPPKVKYNNFNSVLYIKCLLKLFVSPDPIMGAVHFWLCCQHHSWEPQNRILVLGNFLSVSWWWCLPTPFIVWLIFSTAMFFKG